MTFFTFGKSLRPSIHSISLGLQQRYLSDSARTKIASAIAARPVVVFMKGTPSFPQCGFSRAVVQLLDLHSVSPAKLQTYNCLEDQELREGIKEFSDWPTIPQVYVDGEFMGGCDTMMEMHKSGELERLVVDKKLAEPQSSPSAA
ncbi:uncharacterized protein MELLADRAFT_77409 [Melampsora larici-populina 98AG31]|uniref:Monothiol glutaredoxin-5, mitochondrial n=1 Tax=Melampsora larici-populina (strain 98AG31 / pathotype 3-4-7) TaxID=747676 RepID=F4RGZ1_MELLP|nr:uncharacterized protein MELLADRAFT_77409 [Melampsora larici-populina 98AG31]EGG08213.1 hypothetical protein MELLADRAFT_77409 [Melampsora larici-populina 98AG31]